MSWDGGRSGIGAVIVGFRNGNRIVRVSPDSNSERVSVYVLESEWMETWTELSKGNGVCR